MGKIKIISASAGTGKTYRIAGELSQRIIDKMVRPDAVLATTYTNKAADELKSRIRARLVREGQVDAAQRLEASLVGTVNSVCGRLIGEYAFELGLSPDLKVLDEAMAPELLKAAIHSVMTEAEKRELHALGQCLSGLDWLEPVNRVITLARSNRLGSRDFSDCAKRSIDGFMALLKSAPGNAAKIDAALAAAIKAFLERVEPGTVKKTQKAVELVRSVSGTMPVRVWNDWLKLTKLDAGVKWSDEAGCVQSAALEHVNHPSFRKECEDFIRRVFDVAGRALAEYQKVKTERGVLDFVDQEVYALQLLDRPDVQERLGESLDLVLVDEFQDTSPIQLAIFLKLAELARDSIWVGDQKQSIYGFRGTDPALMDAAIASLEDEHTPVEVLKESWRSRAPLVDMTSDLFAKAFEPWGIPQDRVRIKAAAALGPDDTTLGPVLEHWVLDGSNADKRADQMVSAVMQMLAGKSVMVRDMATREVRTVRGGDVAILCDTNGACDLIAGKLAAAGIAAQRASAGLCSTTEGRYVRAGLRYYIDKRDSLAVAEIARMLEYPVVGGVLLEELLAKPHAEVFRELDVVKRIDAAREGNPAAGPLAVFDLVTNAMAVRERCLEWGDAHGRLDNVDALRTRAVEYVALCEAGGKGCTPAGLLGHLDELEKKEKDLKALLPGNDTVAVETWHSSKGREWPVTILYGLESDRSRSTFGVNVFGRDKFNVADPLAGRWIGFWPFPYSGNANATLSNLAEASDIGKKIATQSLFERLRVLYVVWTRARDRLILTTQDESLSGGVLGLLGDQVLLEGEEDDTIVVAGKKVGMIKRTPQAVAMPEKPVKMNAWFAGPVTLTDHVPETVLPSAMKAAGRAGDPEPLGERMALNGKPDMAEIGNAIHGFLAADRADWKRKKRLALAAEILQRGGVAGAVTPEALVAAADNLEQWLAAKWPSALRHREWPVLMRLADGSMLKGTADLVLETGSGYVVIDHKSFPGNQEQAITRAGEHAGQLAAYAGAVSVATGKPIAAMYIHLPVGGNVIPVSLAQQA